MNSLKHGLTAQQIVIGDEDPTEFEVLRDELGEEFAPLGGLESQLVDRLASLLWRIRRVPRFEATVIEAHRAEIARTRTSESLTDKEHHDHLAAMLEKWLSPTQALMDQSVELPWEQEETTETQAEDEKPDSFASEIGMALIRDSQNGDMLGKLSRYEASLLSGFIKTLNMLLLVQSRRVEGARVVNAVPNYRDPAAP
jgi:hypothetical protein